MSIKKFPWKDVALAMIVGVLALVLIIYAVLRGSSEFVS